MYDTANGAEVSRSKRQKTKEAACCQEISRQPSVAPKTVADRTIDTINAEWLWGEHISRRRPLLIRGHLRDSEWSAALWTNEYLQSKAGDAIVEVEHREDREGGYGKGQKLHMRFGDFLERLAAGDDTLYLTTQEVDIGSDGQPELFAPPVAQLASDFPLLPSLSGNLIPHQVNLWMGAAPSGASSGLHHDFHDNLYVLLRGRKHFTLFPPSLARRMYTHGQIRVIHPNGRIVYEGRGDILADGSDAAAVERWQRQRSAETELEAAEAVCAAGEAGAAERLAAAEQALDAVLEAVLKDAGANDDSESEDEGSSGSDAERLLENFHDDFVDSDEETSAAVNGHGSSAAQTSGELVSGADGTGKGSGDEESEPDSFSRVDLAASERDTSAHFPDFPGLQNALQVDVHAGEMLYLPAGWFHEVKSFGAEHMALNYWMHPPDNLDPGPAGFSRPYQEIDQRVDIESSKTSVRSDMLQAINKHARGVCQELQPNSVYDRNCSLFITST